MLISFVFFPPAKQKLFPWRPNNLSSLSFLMFVRVASASPQHQVDNRTKVWAETRSSRSLNHTNITTAESEEDKTNKCHGHRLPQNSPVYDDPTMWTSSTSCSYLPSIVRTAFYVWSPPPTDLQIQTNIHAEEQPYLDITKGIAWISTHEASVPQSLFRATEMGWLSKNSLQTPPPANHIHLYLDTGRQDNLGLFGIGGFHRILENFLGSNLK